MSTPLSTFTAATKAVQDRYATSRCKARRATNDYLRHAHSPTLEGLLDHAGLILGQPPHKDETGETAAQNADHDLHNMVEARAEAAVALTTTP